MIKKVLAAAAFQAEINCLKPILRGFPHLDVIPVKTGLGPRKAYEKVASALKNHPADLLLSFGFCGGLSEALGAGDRFFPEEVLYRGRIFSPKNGFGNRGRLLSQSRLVFSPDKKRRLGGEHQAQAVDMESGVIAEAAEAHGVPWLVLRVVFDSASERLALWNPIFLWRRYQDCRPKLTQGLREILESLK